MTDPVIVPMIAHSSRVLQEHGQSLSPHQPLLLQTLVLATFMHVNNCSLQQVLQHYMFVHRVDCQHLLT